MPRSFAACRWEFSALSCNEARVAALAAELRISPLSARILLQRGCVEPGVATAFLSRRMDLLHDPAKLPDMALAVGRIAEAVDKKQHIVIFGDYDADGVTSTALLARFFRFLSRKPGMRVNFEALVPERKQGYGLSLEALLGILARKPDLVITLDNGTTAHEAIDTLRAQGIDCIVADHHLPGETLPRALAIINPKRCDAGNSYPFGELCGAGVTFKLVWALSVHFSQNKKVSPEFREFLLEAMVLAAIGTVADVMPLIDENRVLVHHGLKLLPHTKLPGLRALLEIARLLPLDRNDGGGISPGDIGFRIGPRLNAAGRCANASDALELLLTDDPARGTELARKLDGLNAERQGIEETILREARAQAQATLEQRPACRGFVLSSADWHQGVIGIAASRIVEEFHRPALLLTINTERGMAHGSGRSIAKLNLYDALHGASAHLTTFGGHAAAAGLTLECGKIDVFRAVFEAVVSTLISEEDLTPRLRVDGRVEMAQLTAGLCSELELFEPCGAGNPRPTLALCGVELPAPPRLMGSGEKHVQFFARQSGQARRVIAFNGAGHFNALCDFTRKHSLDIAFRPQLNTFRGESSVELLLEAYRVSEQ